MKEITAIIRRDKVPETRLALEAMGFPALTLHSVEGRGKQKGMIEEIDPEMPGEYETGVRLVPTPSEYAREHPLPKAVRYVPKRMLQLLVPDEAVASIVRAIIQVNRTGYPGDGKIFVSPVEDAVRIRTGERGEAALSYPKGRRTRRGCSS